MQMELLTRSLRVSLISVFALALLPAGSALAAPAAEASAVKPPASVRVASCRSNQFYSGREITFRTRMWRTAMDASERLEVKVEVQRKFDEAKSYRRLKIEALAKPTTSKDDAATIYQRDVMLREVESAARYRAKVTFRWRDAATGKTIRKRVIVSKTCRQRHGLPKLAISPISSTPVVPVAGAMRGEASVIHRLSVQNSGRSEAVDVPIALRVDGNPPIVGLIESIGPRQVAEIAITAPACKIAAEAMIDPLGTLKRLDQAMRTPVAVPSC